MAYTNPGPGGTRTIDKRGTFCGVLAAGLPDPDKPISEIMAELEKAVRGEYPAVTDAALANARGNWYEWLLSIAAWNTHIRHRTGKFAVGMPNVAQFDCI